MLPDPPSCARQREPLAIHTPGEEYQVRLPIAQIPGPLPRRNHRVINVTDPLLANMPFEGICHRHENLWGRPQPKGQHGVDIHLAIPSHGLQGTVLRVNGNDPLGGLYVGLREEGTPP